jgi:hypothetical protein
MGDPKDFLEYTIRQAVERGNRAYWREWPGDGKGSIVDYITREVFAAMLPIPPQESSLEARPCPP